jgi:hypothetical protein
VRTFRRENAMALGVDGAGRRFENRLGLLRPGRSLCSAVVCFLCQVSSISGVDPFGRIEGHCAGAAVRSREIGELPRKGSRRQRERGNSLSCISPMIHDRRHGRQSLRRRVRSCSRVSRCAVRLGPPRRCCVPHGSDNGLDTTGPDGS